MNNIRMFKHTKLTWSVLRPRYYALFSNTTQNCQFFVYTSRKSNISSYLNVSLKPVRYISKCSLLHTGDSDIANEKNVNEEKIRKILEDTEFQNILKDFASDFGVDGETNELLDDIRKNIDGNSEQENLTTNSGNEMSSLKLSEGHHQKYKEVSDAVASVIHSYEEKYDLFAEDEPSFHIDHELKPTFPYNYVKRGTTGVFDLDELIQLLRMENLLDVTSIAIPKEFHYADFLVLVTAKSERHSEVVAGLIKKIYKQKKNKKDPFVIVEGKDVPEWKAMDMGNIVLHIFLEEARALYDIESLWLFDTKFDSGGHILVDPMLSVIEEEMEFFNSLQQSNSPELSKDIS